VTKLSQLKKFKKKRERHGIGYVSNKQIEKEACIAYSFISVQEKLEATAIVGRMTSLPSSLSKAVRRHRKYRGFRVSSTITTVISAIAEWYSKMQCKLLKQIAQTKQNFLTATFKS